MDGASAIICWDKKILLFLRDNKPTIPYPDYWQLPGGGIEKGETPDEAVRRELEEEVSYVPKSLNYLGQVKRPGNKRSYLYYSFVGKIEAGKFKIGQMEGQAIAFFSLDEISKIKITPNVNQYLKKRREVFEKILEKKSFSGFDLLRESKDLSF